MIDTWENWCLYYFIHEWILKVKWGSKWTNQIFKCAFDSETKRLNRRDTCCVIVNDFFFNLVFYSSQIKRSIFVDSKPVLQTVWQKNQQQGISRSYYMMRTNKSEHQFWAKLNMKNKKIPSNLTRHQMSQSLWSLRINNA